ncbi:MAG: DEAD/DEAH box helicase, partial [Candidatus Rokuibacteriota bacterium]
MRDLRRLLQPIDEVRRLAVGRRPAPDHDAGGAQALHPLQVCAAMCLAPRHVVVGRRDAHVVDDHVRSSIARVGQARSIPSSPLPAGALAAGAGGGGVILWENMELFERFRARYPFPLDDFQIEAAHAIESGQSVIVSAPTGAGKTLVAEFAIHAALAAGRRIAYTTPLKALSNQKFADFT